jgi:hypothetical protein
MSKSKAMRWPYGIALSFVLIIALIVGTIIVASDNAVEPSDLYMSDYHHVDENINELIRKKIAFDQKYEIRYLNEGIKNENMVLAYQINNRDGSSVNDAVLKVKVTRPNTHAFNLELKDPQIVEGRYTFAPINLPKEGRWNLMAYVKVGENERYYNLKADTRYTQTFEF